MKRLTVFLISSTLIIALELVIRSDDMFAVSKHPIGFVRLCCIRGAHALFYLLKYVGI